VYRGAEDNITTEAVITYKQHWLYGRVSLGLTHHHFIMETIPGDGLVIWAEINQGVWNDERRPPIVPLENTPEDERIIPVETMRELLAQVRGSGNRVAISGQDFFVEHFIDKKQPQ